jgi:phenylpropionate dioxygenase-like ring-hydroxylating dioxygenase large terminal subunit
MTTCSPIPLAEFDASIQDPLNARFFPPEAYTSPAFHRFELGAIWYREWLCAGRLEEIPKVGDYFSVRMAGEPLLVVRAAQDDVIAMSAVCRHRGMIVAEGKGHSDGGFVCPYHRWTYDRRGQLIGAPQMSGIGSFDASATRLPRMKVEIWRGFIFVNMYEDAAPLRPRLAAIEPIVHDYGLEHLRGEFLRDPGYHFHFDAPWNWKAYAEGQSECYHCDKLHGETPVMRGMDCSTIEMGAHDPVNGVFSYSIRARAPDVTLNHLGRAVFPAIETLGDEQRRITHAVTIAPGLFMQLLPDCVIAVSWSPSGPSSVGVKRHRLYPATTLERDDFVELHALETTAAREFVAQDEFALDRVQVGLQSRYAPRGPVSRKERLIFGFNTWLVERYRNADRKARGHESGD